MSQNIHTYSAKIGEEEIIIEAGRLAFQANGAVTVRQADTIILSTATMAAKPREGTDFFPLTVDYEERLYAAGKIPGSFFKREGKASENAILICRLTDRPIRPLFPKGMRNDVQIVMTALSADQEHFIDIMSIIGASAALTISDIPFHGPVGAVRVGYIDGQFRDEPDRDADGAVHSRSAFGGHARCRHHDRSGRERSDRRIDARSDLRRASRRSNP